MRLPSQRAFSLVELSIVLVILGLLTGGILAGRSLIRASELRNVTVEYDRYNTATKAFRDKYFATPGDITNATKFWGKNSTNCNGLSDPAGTPGTCNGNGDGAVTHGTCATMDNESFFFWQHLALAGIIEGSYTGATGGGNGTCYPSSAGTNVPASKLANGAWYAGPGYRSDTRYFSTTTAKPHQFQIGRIDTTSTYPQAAVMTPQEAWNIDSKVDDGMPGLGRVNGYTGNPCSSSATAATATYLLTSSDIGCPLMFPLD